MIADVTVRDAGEKGLGVFALRDFTKGEFIFRWRHVLIDHFLQGGIGGGCQHLFLAFEELVLGVVDVL